MKPAKRPAKPARRPAPGAAAAPSPTAPARRALVAILALALGLRLATVLWLRDTVPFSDYLYYHLAGQKIASDWSFFFDTSQVEYYGKFGWWPPVYPFFIGALYALFGVHHRIVVFLQVALGTLVVALVYLLARQAARHLAGAAPGDGDGTPRDPAADTRAQRIGLVAAFLIAIDPTYVFATNLLASENLFVVWLALGLYLWMRAGTRRRALAAAGAVLGLGALTRAIGLLVPAVAALPLRARFARRRAWLAGSAVLLAGTAAVVLPWTARNALVVGRPALVCFGGGLNFYFGHNEAGIGYRDLSQTPMARLTTQVAIDDMGYRLGWSYIAEHPGRFFARAGRKIVDLFRSPAWAMHDNSAILLPDGWRTDPVKGAIARALRERQRARNAWLDGLFTRLGEIHTAVIGLGAVLAALLLYRHMSPEMRLFGYLVVYWIVAHVMFWAQPRFRYPIDIALAIWTAAALVHLHARRITRKGSS